MAILSKMDDVEDFAEEVDFYNDMSHKRGGLKTNYSCFSFPFF